MDPTVNDFLEAELMKLESISGILGTALVNRNGLSIISRLPRTINEKKLGAMTATMFEAMESATESLNDDFLNLTVEYDDYQVLIIMTSSKHILITLLEYDLDLGIILIEIEESINKIQELLKEG